MTSAERSCLVALRDGWRASSERWEKVEAPATKPFADGHIAALEDCADELDAILSASRESEQASTPGEKTNENEDIQTRVESSPYSEGSGLPQRPTRCGER